MRNKTMMKALSIGAAIAAVGTIGFIAAGIKDNNVAMTISFAVMGIGAVIAGFSVIVLLTREQYGTSWQFN